MELWAQRPCPPQAEPMEETDSLWGRVVSCWIQVPQGRVRHGAFTLFQANGKPLEEGFFKAGQPHGPWKQYHLSGAISLTGGFFLGGKSQVWEAKDPQGKTLYTLSFPGPAYEPKGPIYDGTDIRGVDAKGQPFTIGESGNPPWVDRKTGAFAPYFVGQSFSSKPKP
ncbi:hypothetical protein D7Y13_19715 [Corallococcus praedator]|uniref:Uncharacterized protein n=2 Tax=Myxococcaceae TaxID=31 RepID=A0ABX9QI87_9BACT|nr:hypothetical protein D7X75_27310 [Corallococcus sp. CA031C]RKI06663.1 hypothetical protein D7Y13_19715 [Corallococcus praedator]